MMFKTGLGLGLFLVGLSSASANLLTNGDFGTGDLTGWTRFTTANGTTTGSAGSPVEWFNTTGSGASLAAHFGVAQVTHDETQQGGGLFQFFASGAGAVSISADIAARNGGAHANLEAGVFNLLLDSIVVDSVSFGEISFGSIERDALSYSGALDAGMHELRILITRPFLAPISLSQYVDNVNVDAAAIPEPATLGLLGIGLAGLALGGGLGGKFGRRPGPRRRTA